MSIDLPKPIAAFVAANARLDLDGMLHPFTPDVALFDNGKRFIGKAELRRLFETEVIAAKAVFTPDAIHQSGHEVVLEGPTQGNFPGSPIRFTYRFTLEGDAITSLAITL